MNSAQEPKQFHCKCRDVLISLNQLISHLKLSGKHAITKINSPPLSTFNLDEGILSKIESIARIKNEILQSSLNLIRIISLNTENSMKKLDDLTGIYRNIRLDLSELEELRKNEIFGSFGIDLALKSGLVHHFDQQIIGQKWNGKTKKNMIKNQVSGILITNCLEITSTAVFDNENFFVTGSGDGAIRVWSMKSKIQTGYYFKHKNEVTTIALGHENKYLLSGSSDFTVRLWNLDLKMHVTKFLGHLSGIFNVAISRDNTKGYSTSQDYTLKIWNLVAKNIEYTLNCGIYPYLKLLNQDKCLLLSDHLEGLIFLNLTSQEIIKIEDRSDDREPLSGNISCFSLTIDESIIIAGHESGKISVWQVATFTKVSEHKNHTGKVWMIEITPDLEYFASTSNDLTVVIWNYKSMSILYSLKYKFYLRGLIYLRNTDDYLIVTTNGGIYNLNHRTGVESRNCLKTEIINSKIEISKDLRYLAFANKMIKLIDLQNNEKLYRSSPFKSKILSFTFASDSSALFCGFNEDSLLILDIPWLTKLNTISFGISKISVLCISRDKNLIFCSDADENSIVWNDQKRIIDFKKKGVAIKNASFCLNDEKLILACDEIVFILNKDYQVVKFIFLGKLCFKGDIKIITTEDDRYALIKANKWMCIDLNSCSNFWYNSIRDIKSWILGKRDLRIYFLINNF